jgi:hypothetical protein
MRNYEPKFLRVSRNYDFEVHENYEIIHFRILTTKKIYVFNENLRRNYELS